MNRLVSVIVVTYNDSEHIGRCLAGLLAQSYHPVEIIVVDNNSGDGTADLVRRDFPSVRVVETGDNRGYLGGVRSGLVYARGEYIAVVNPDTWPQPGWLRPLADLLDSTPNAGAATSQIVLADRPSLINARGLSIHVSGLGFVRDLNRHALPAGDLPAPVPGLSGCAFLVRRDLLGQLINVVADGFLYHDDVALSWLIRLLGYEIYYVPSSQIEHQYNLSMDARKFYLLERNRLAMLVYALQPLPFLAYLPVFALTELITLGYALLKGPSYLSAKLRAWAFVARQRRSLMAKRRYVQGMRRVSDWKLFRHFQIGYPWSQLITILRPTQRYANRGIR